MANLRFTNDANKEEFVHVGPDCPEVVVGRNKECELRVRNNTVSRQHAKVVWSDGTYRLIDLGSANGTFHNRKRVENEIELEDGETFFCGSQPVEFLLEESDLPAPEPELEPASVVEPVSVSEPPPPVPAHFQEHATQSAPAVRATIGYQVTGSEAAVADVEVESVDNLKHTLGYDADESRALVAAARAGAAAQLVATARPEASSDDDEVVSFSGASRPAPKPAGKGAAKAKVAEPLDPGAATIVRIEDRAPEARKLLAEEKRREEAGVRQDVRAGELEAQVAERDATIRQLGIQVEDLGRVVARLQSEAHAEDEAAVRVTDMERVLAAAEAEKAGIEEALEAEKARAQAAGTKAVEAADALARVTRERDQLSVETQRWDALKRQFEEERTQVQGEVEALRRQVTETTARLAEAEGAAGRAEEASRSLQALGEEMAQQKVANRSYLKKISRLLEENEKLKAAPTATAGTEAETAALRTENASLRTEIETLRKGGETLRTDLAASKALADRMAQRVAALEAAPPAAPAGAGVVAAREALDRANELASQGRTSLEVIQGLVPELAEKLAAGPEKDDMVDQVNAAVTDLAECTRDVKAEILKARRSL